MARKRSSSASRSRRGSTKGKGRARSSRKARSAPAPRLGPWLAARLRRHAREGVGLLLAGLGLFSLLALLSPTQSSLSTFWLDLLRRGFGWGVYFLPLGLLAGGGALLLRALGDRFPLPAAEQWVGGAMLYLTLLALLQALTGGASWEAALEAAGSGRGGGLVGGAVLALLVRALGGPGAAVALAAWSLAALTLLADLSVAELFALGVEGGRALAGRLRSRRRPPTPTAAPLPEAVAAPPARTSRPEIAPPAVAGPAADAPAPEARAWQLPDLTAILEPGTDGGVDEAYDRDRARLIEETLQAFGAPAHVVEINRGPTVTQFGVEPDFIESRGGRRIKVKVSKIASLADDLALALAAPSIRIQAPVPGKGYVGIEVPNEEISLVALRDVMESEAFQKIPSRLRIGLGRDVSGRPVAADLAAMPHLLIAGTTGSGKSVCINAILACLLLQNTPEDLRFVMVDPKRVELTFYNGIPHLLAPVVVDLERVVPALQWVAREMDERYRRFSHEGVRNLAEYNERMRLTGGQTLPYLVIVVDELADLMMLAPDETERVLTRLAQLARATGIHLVIATQRPSVDVVTGLIKANFPARIAFAVASSVDSRVILDQPGAERLLGRGDMLFLAPDAAAPVRLQGVYVSEVELGRLIRYWKNAALGGEATQPTAPSAPAVTIPAGAPLKQAPLWEELEEAGDEDLDPLFDEAVRVVREMRRASISLLQRRLRIGYTRAARLIDQLEARGIVGPEKGGSLPREVLDYGEAASTPETPPAEA